MPRRQGPLSFRQRSRSLCTLSGFQALYHLDEPVRILSDDVVPARERLDHPIWICRQSFVGRSEWSVAPAGRVDEDLFPHTPPPACQANRLAKGGERMGCTSGIEMRGRY